MLYSFVTVLSVFLLFFLLVALKKNVGENAVSAVEKTIGFLLLFVVIAKGFFKDSFIMPIDGIGENPVSLSEPYDLAETVIRWLLAFSEAFAIASVVADSSAVRRVLIGFSLPLTFISLGFLDRSIGYVTTNPGEEIWLYGFYLPDALRVTACIFERVAVILLSLSYAFLTHRGEYLTKKGKRAVARHLLLGIPFSMPFYTPGTLFGVTDHIIGIGDPLQIVWIAVIFLGFLAVYLFYRGESERERRAFSAFLIVTLAIHYSMIYLHGFRMNRLPLQLCNLATYLLLLLLFVKKQWLFDFILVANCPGCVIAIATVTENTPMFGFWAMHYYVQHTLVFIIPLLLAALGVFRMPKPKEAVRHYLIGFTAFYFFCLLLNALENGVLAQAEGLNEEIFNISNYFYLCECPVDALSGLYAVLCVGKVSIFGSDFYLGYLIFVYVVFSLLAIGEYYLNYGIGKLFGKRRTSSFFIEKTASA